MAGMASPMSNPGMGGFPTMSPMGGMGGMNPLGQPNMMGQAQFGMAQQQFAQTQMGSPFAALVLQDMGLNEKTALYAYFTETPSESFSNKIDSLRECQFSLREVL